MLTDKEIRAIQAQHPTENDPMPFAQALITATVAKLAADVSVEPVAFRYRREIGELSEWCATTVYGTAQHYGNYEGLFTLDQLQTAIAQARCQALGEAAKVCEAKNPHPNEYSDDAEFTTKIAVLGCADAIRALIGGKT